MRKGLALVATALFLAFGLAGCSSAKSGDFSVKAPGAPGGEYVFTASGSADNYTWDLGDRLTTLYGKSVHHAYDFKDGNITVVLTTKKGTQTEEHRKSVVLGTGKNGVPTFILEGLMNWTITGETMAFTAAKSSDPDHDPLRYTWSCVRTADAVRLPTHTHPGFGGIPFATPPAGSVTSLNLQGPLPKVDRVVSGDLCDALGSGGKPSKDTTIQGSFTKTGIYDVYLLASDPVHPTTSGKYHFVVTKPDERPARVQDFAFSGTFQGGTGSLQSFGDQAMTGMTFDEATHPFSLPLNGKGGYITMSYVNDQFPGVTNITWVLKRGSTLEVAHGAGNGSNVTLSAPDMKASSYLLDVKLNRGLQVGYNIHVSIPLDMDPFKVY